MALLKHLHTGTTISLAAHHVVGRSRACQLKLTATSVSAIHAELSWTDHAWHVRDLGSRNGTFVAGRRISPGHPIALALDDDIRFGPADDHYRLIDVSPPRLIAFGPDHAVVAEDDVLCLPSAADCAAIVFRDASARWVVERVDGTRAIDDGECVIVDDTPYFVHLPSGQATTRDLAQGSSDGRLRANPDDGVLEFQVSRDGEHVALRLHRDTHVLAIESRAHSFLLLALARARIADSERCELPDSEHGWIYREDLMKHLAIGDPQLINLWVCRARQQFAQMKLHLAARLIERRETSGQLRVGVPQLRIIDA